MSDDTVLSVRVRVFEALPEDAPDDANTEEYEVESADLDGDTFWVYLRQDRPETPERRAYRHAVAQHVQADDKCHCVPPYADTRAPHPPGHRARCIVAEKALALAASLSTPQEVSP